MLDTKHAEDVIYDVASSVDMERYRRYVEYIRPTTAGDLFRRWIFAYASVHTTWQTTCRLYRGLRDYDQWLGNQDKLKARLIACRAGMHNNRARYISEFSAFFWDHPTWFWRHPDEQWTAYRARLQASAIGIGPAKSSFAIELIYPGTADVICTDVHLMKVYGLTTAQVGTMSRATERAAEAHWVDTSRHCGLAPVLARWAMWDSKFGYSDPRFWSYVLEPLNFHAVLRATDLK